MKYTFTIFFLLIISLGVNSQEIFSVKKVRNIKLNVSSLIDPVYSYQISFEYGIKNRLTIQNEFGIITNFSPYYKKYQKLSGIRLKNEIRYYFLKKNNKKSDKYFASEIQWVNYNYAQNQEFFDETAWDGGPVSFWSEVKWHKNIFAFHQKIGLQINSKKTHFLFDIYTGLGVRYIYSEKVLPSTNKILEENTNLIIDLIERYPDGKHILPSFTLGCKIGFSLKK